MFGTYWTSRLRGHYWWLLPLGPAPSVSITLSCSGSSCTLCFSSFFGGFSFSPWLFTVGFPRAWPNSLLFWLNMPSVGDLFSSHAVRYLWHPLFSTPSLLCTVDSGSSLYLLAIYFQTHTSSSIWVRFLGLFCLPYSLCQGHHQALAFNHLT